MAKLAVTASGGNVFADLGLADAEGQHVKAGLVSKLAEVIADRGLSQTAAAKLTGISQPDLSKVLRGRFRDFSEARLMRALAALDSEVEITVRHDGREIGDPIRVRASA
ncbi:MAG: XRE family transcriptional regulator [Alphaproteobacteria bacterium]|nr:MAG: XRE family transcriptional regulator [Alphaproteobacteria bacterium]